MNSPPLQPAAPLSHLLPGCTVGGGSFTVGNATPSRNQLQIGGGVTMAMTNALALHAAYHVVLPTGNLIEHIVEAGASYRF